MLSFKRETCEGIIQHLEMREHTERCDMQVRDIGNDTSPDARVEMTFRFGDQLYAIEHTPASSRLMASWSIRIDHATRLNPSKKVLPLRWGRYLRRTA
jgi:hypothetical protein